MSNNNQKQDSAVASSPSATASKPAVIGYVEHFEPTVIEGWAIHAYNNPIQLILRVVERLYTLDVAWIERKDVAQQHGEQFTVSGYRIMLPWEVTVAVKDALRNGQPVEVLADGVALHNVARMPTPEGLLQTEPLLLGTRSAELDAAIEAWGHFTLYGWAVVGGLAPTAYTLHANGAVQGCFALTRKRPDVAQVLGIEKVDVGFEIELPGYLWETVPENDEAHLEIRVGGMALAAEPLILSRAKAARWVMNVCRMDEGQEKQYRTLLAIEHVRYGKLSLHLDEETRIFLRGFAERMHLGDFLSGDEPSDIVTTGSPPDIATELLRWKMLRMLNTRLTDTSGPILPHVKAVLEAQRMLGQVRENFLFSAVPALCRSGEFVSLRELLDFSRLIQFEGSYDVWELSLAIPALVVSGDIHRATEVLWRVPKHFGRGWLNTECVRFALEETLRIEAEGAIDPDTAKQLCYAVVGLLDAFKGEWFSRLHDQELVDTVISLLAHLGRYPDQRREDAVVAAIRIYGLNPTFWKRLALRGVVTAGELRRAQQVWEGLSSMLTETSTPLVKRLPPILEGLEYFLRHDNPEAVMMLREVIAHALPDLNRSLTPAGRKLIEHMLESDSIEVLRIAAASLADDNRLVEHFLETSENLSKILRTHTFHACSPVFSLQEEGAGLLAEVARLAEEKDASALTSTLTCLEDKAAVLANWQGHFLGADLLAQAYRLVRSAGLPDDTLLMRLMEVFRQAIAKTSPNGYLPVPVQAAFAQLSALPADEFLTGYLAEMYTHVREKFGDRHDDLFQPSPGPRALELAGQGWPADTLVVVYSCRKYLDTRVAAIRETWVQDLKARGIPYVVLVGDGDDTLQGDVLALDVSDRYEDLPKKTLKLFDWVYRNTDAQYVLKIDDDCYLDVGRYFDTLSYRKHAYYGRILRRKAGDMDRLWHQPKSHGLHSQKAIDKSPEPSIYADGGGAYCLSRLAMRKLLEMERSDAGKRLMACSFMEDKLVGDLLAMVGILPSDEDYESYQRRRTFGDAMPVGMWENTFYPCAVTPTKVVHLDTERDLAWVRENARGTTLWPKKIWPTCWKPTISGYTNQLELLTDAKKSEVLLQNELVVVAVERNEMTMLPHFLAHYRMLGVNCFIFVDNCSDDGSREYLYGQPDVVLYSADTEYKQSHFGVAWQQAVMGNLCLNKWVLIADADELLVYENCEKRPLADLVAEVEAEGADAIRVDMIDMYPFGDLNEADFTQSVPFEAAPWFDQAPITPWRLGSGWFSNSTSYVSHLRHRLLPNAVPHDFVSQKFALLRYRPWVRVSQGVHYAANLTVSSKSCWFAHFKYHSGFKDKVLTEIHRGQHFNNAAEYRRYAALLTEGKGGFGKESVSKRYESSASFAMSEANQTEP